MQTQMVVINEHVGMETGVGLGIGIFDTDTLSLIPVPERYFFRYQFYEISFNKITLSQKCWFYFFSLLTFIQTQSLVSWATAQRNKSYTIQ